MPDLFRCAIVCPVHKKGKRCDPQNKRPVSLTVVASKLLESVLCTAIYENANRQGLLHDAQYAYRPGLSATLQLIDTQFEWARLMKDGKCFDAIYFDFKSAFETVTHHKLIELLPSYGVGPRLVAWIADYLSRRTFRVRVNSSLSRERCVSSGCPQGTCIGPLMFLLYIDSIKLIVPPDLGMRVYADDVKFFRQVDTGEQNRSFEETLVRFEKWCSNLDLKLSVGKCVVLHFGQRNQKHTYYINGQALTAVSDVKDLGVFTSTNLRYSAHTIDVVRRTSIRANHILRSFIIKSPSLYITLFRIYTMPILLYSGVAPQSTERQGND